MYQIVGFKNSCQTNFATEPTAVLKLYKSFNKIHKIMRAHSKAIMITTESQSEILRYFCSL